MGSKTIQNIQKIFKATSGVLFGRKTAGPGRGEELTPSDVRTMLSVSTTSETATLLAAKADLVGGLVPAGQLPSYVDDVIEAANQAAFPATGEAGKIYVALDTSRTYRWSGSAYVELTDSTAVWGSVSGTLSNQTDLNSAISAKQATLVSGTNLKTINSTSLLGSGDITVGGLSGTGSVDNAALRADGTGGATLQASAWVINDNLTASPNNTVNHACLEATGSTTNVSVSIKPKGTGAFCLAAPDGTTAGGNARGANAIDLQTFRGTAASVASGNYSVVVGSYNTASGSYSRAIGHNNTASGSTCLAIGHSCTASADDTVAIGSTATASAANGVAIGNSSTASGNGGVAIGSSNTASSPSAVAIGLSCTASGLRSRATGWASLADRYGQTAHSAGIFAAIGDAQRVEFLARNKTTNNTATTLFLDGASTRLTIPSGKILFADLMISGIKSDGSAAACYKRKVVIKNVGGTTSLVGSIQTIGTDIEDNASTDVAITADDTNDALQINVTGIASETWRWVAVVEGIEIAYGT